jgi:hypothetical protein
MFLKYNFDEIIENKFRDIAGTANQPGNIPKPTPQCLIYLY